MWRRPKKKNQPPSIQQLSYSDDQAWIELWCLWTRNKVFYAALCCCWSGYEVERIVTPSPRLKLFCCIGSAQEALSASRNHKEWVNPMTRTSRTSLRLNHTFGPQLRRWSEVASPPCLNNEKNMVWWYRYCIDRSKGMDRVHTNNAVGPRSKKKRKRKKWWWSNLRTAKKKCVPHLYFCFHHHLWSLHNPKAHLLIALHNPKAHLLVLLSWMLRGLDHHQRQW